MGNRIITGRVKGITQYYAPGHMREFQAGDFLRLVPEFENYYDHNAIAIYDDNNHKLGFVDRNMNVEIYRLMTSTDFFCIVTSVYSNPETPSIEYQFIYNTPDSILAISEDIFWQYCTAYNPSQNEEPNNGTLQEAIIGAWATRFKIKARKQSDNSWVRLDKHGTISHTYGEIKKLMREMAECEGAEAHFGQFSSEQLYTFFMMNMDIIIQQLIINAFGTIDAMPYSALLVLKNLPEYDDFLIHYDFDVKSSWDDIYWAKLQGGAPEIETQINGLVSTQAGDFFLLFLKFGFLFVPLFELRIKTYLMLFNVGVVGLDEDDKNLILEKASTGNVFLQSTYYDEFDDWRRSLNDDSNVGDSIE